MAGQGFAARPGESRPGAGVASANVLSDLPPLENLQDAMRRIAGSLDLTVRKGANKPGSLGTYNFSTQIVRLNESGGNAFVTFGHELGHHVENVVGRPLSSLIGQNANVMQTFGGTMTSNMKPSLWLHT
jgi:hypothetical protein